MQVKTPAAAVLAGVVQDSANDRSGVGVVAGELAETGPPLPTIANGPEVTEHDTEPLSLSPPSVWPPVMSAVKFAVLVAVAPTEAPVLNAGAAL